MFHYLLFVMMLPYLVNAEKLKCPDGNLICPDNKECCLKGGRYECCDSSNTDVKETKALTRTPGMSLQRCHSNSSSGSFSAQNGIFDTCNELTCSGGTCCSNTECCSAENADCCSKGSSHCCINGAKCCQEGCCESGQKCCDGGCCESGDKCCVGGCCESGNNCCEGGCCEGGHSCCGSGCCPERGATWKCCYGLWCCNAPAVCDYEKGCIAAGVTFTPAVVTLCVMFIVSMKSTFYFA